MLLSKLLSKIEYTGSFADREITHITNNSLEATESSVFVCVKGFSTDGHLFASHAYANGCRCFVVQNSLDGLPADASVLKVSDSREALAYLSCELYENPSHELSVIGITGTKGKTTTALMIKQVLESTGIPTGYIGSNGISYGNCKFESTNTTPESCRLQMYLRKMADSGIKCVAMEVSSQALLLGRTLGIKFKACIFTNLSPDHIGAGEHPDFESYFNAKKKLFSEYECGTVIANADDGYTEKMLDACQADKIFYSISRASDYTADDIKLCRTESILGVSFTYNSSGKHVYCTLPVPGDFNIYNALSAVACAKLLGSDDEAISKALAKINIDGRFETILTPRGSCFIIDYAHNGLSLMSVLKSLRKYEPRRLICLFGSVGCRTQVRRIQMGEAAAKYADFSILTSDNPDTENPQDIIDEIATQFKDKSSYVSIPDRKEAIEFAYNTAKNGDIVLLAGKGHEKYQYIFGKREYFCEREIIEDCINSDILLKNK